MSHDDLTDDTPTDVPWFPWIFFACLLAAVAWFATDGGEGSYPEPLPGSYISPPSPPVAETPASAAGVASGVPAPQVEPRTPENCEEGL